MKRTLAIFALFGMTMMMSAQKIHNQFKNANLPDVLKYIDQQMKGGHVQFVYDDLDGIKVTHNFSGQTPLDAVKLAIGAYPIKVTEDEGDIYVEYDKSIIKDIVLDNVTIYGNDEAVSTINYMRRAMRFSVTCPQEKVYVHLDNTGYFMGETIWFKAYVKNAATQQRTDLSHTLYVELVNPDGEVMKTQKLYIENGEAQGSFLLEKMYSTGFYEIRAYTRYMLNWGSATAFSRVIPVFKQPEEEGDYSKMVIDQFSYRKRHPSYRQISEDVVDKSEENTLGNLLKAKRLPKGDVNVHFYPEGGNLVEDLASKVAFTVNDSEGLFFDCTCELVDEEGNVVSSAVTYKEGRGCIELTASDEPQYLSLTTAEGKKQKFQLPEPEQEGIALKLNTLRDDYVTAHLTPSRSMYNHLLGYTLMNQGRILTCDTMTCERSIELKFERAAIPAGVNQLTLFDADGRILAERLFFICPPKEQMESVKISSPTTVLKPCGEVELNIHSHPNSSISLSATDVSTLPNGKQGNALTWMLLASDLKGYIANPEYYFESDDREHRIQADLLMMVQGWRRYDWNLMSQKAEFKQIYPIEDALYLDGQIKPTKKNVSVANQDIECVLYNIRSGEWLKGTTKTDSIGKYAFKAPDMSGTWNLIFSMNHETKAKAPFHIGIDRTFSPQPRYLSPYETARTAEIKANLFENVPDSLYENLTMPAIMKRKNMLPEAKVKAKRRIFEGARAAWETEKVGQYWATIHYDIDAEVNRIIDRGEEPPSFFQWLYAKNPLFTSYGADRFIPMAEESNIKKKDSGESKSRIWSAETMVNKNEWTIGVNSDLVFASNGSKSRIMDNGLEYKNRPVVWILNNCVYGITTAKHYASQQIEREMVVYDAVDLDIFPTFLEEVKAIYISEQSRAYWRHLYCPYLDASDAVTVFVYTHHTNWRRFENLPKDFKIGPRTHRQTYFDGYNEPETFHMDDYSVLPPMEDFRRTIYWEPNIKTDDKGNAKVKFYNNSSARKLYISAEGMDSKGNMIVNF